MNILAPTILIFAFLYGLVFSKRISNTTLKILLLLFICIALSFELLKRIKPNTTNFYNKCFINENKNKLGPGNCYYDADCKGDRTCSHQGKCFGKSNC